MEIRRACLLFNHIGVRVCVEQYCRIHSHQTAFFLKGYRILSYKKKVNLIAERVFSARIHLETGPTRTKTGPIRNSGPKSGPLYRTKSIRSGIPDQRTGPKFAGPEFRTYGPDQ